MSLYDEEFDKAFKKTLSRHPTVNEDLGRSVLAKLQEFLKNEETKPGYDRQAYGEVLRRTLNHFHLQGLKRTVYSSLAGAFFGQRGGRKAAAARRTSKEVKKALPEEPTNSSTVVILKGNQYTWDI